MSLCVCVWGGGGEGGGGRGVTGRSCQTHVCHDKIMLATTKLLSRQNYVCHDKYWPQQTRACHNKSKFVVTVFVATKLCLSLQIFVVTKVLSQQKYVLEKSGGRESFFITVEWGGGGTSSEELRDGLVYYTNKSQHKLWQKKFKTCIFGHMGPSEKHQKPAVWKTCSFRPQAKLGPHFQRSKH